MNAPIHRNFQGIFDQVLINEFIDSVSLDKPGSNPTRIKVNGNYVHLRGNKTVWRRRQDAKAALKLWISRSNHPNIFEKHGFFDWSMKTNQWGQSYIEFEKRSFGGRTHQELLNDFIDHMEKQGIVQFVAA